ncbi:MAG: hypothetical protein NC489_33475 [Ruminococcus flavefaciens]|nr:hypothetical protein [Ruminococcus flavefaciens]
MDIFFSKEEVNTGRQREFDYLKGIFMLLIYLIHAFQATASPEDTAASWIYMFATMSGAAIFIFVMGIGTVYSRNATVKAFARSGVRMVVYQYLNNLAYVAALLLPYLFIAGKRTESMTETLRFFAEIYIQYTNIFFITGIIYFVLALLKKWKVDALWYALIGIAVSIAAPFLYGRPVEVPVLGYLMKLLIGEAAFVSFTPLYFLSYALLGVAFGSLLRHVRDKMKFYKILAIPALVIVILWWVLLFMKYDCDIPSIQAFLSEAYTQPDLWHVAASLAHIILLAELFFFLEELRKKREASAEPKNPAARQLLYYSRHISKYYALHILVYFFAFGLHAYEGFQGYQCWLLALLSIVITELMVRGFNYWSKRKQ